MHVKVVHLDPQPKSHMDGINGLPCSTTVTQLALVRSGLLIGTDIRSFALLQLPDVKFNFIWE